jgi:nitrogen fixation protein FixH
MSGNDVVAGAGWFELKGWMVLVLLLSSFGVVVGVNAVMIHYAVSTFSGEQEVNPYEHGLAYEKDIKAAQVQEALGWHASAGVSRNVDRKVLVEVDVTDASHMPVSGLAFTSALGSPIDKKLDKHLSLSETAPGVYSGGVAADAGQWDLLLEASRDGARIFRSKNRITLH